MDNFYHKKAYLKKLPPLVLVTMDSDLYTYFILKLPWKRKTSKISIILRIIIKQFPCLKIHQIFLC